MTNHSNSFTNGSALEKVKHKFATKKVKRQNTGMTIKLQILIVIATLLWSCKSPVKIDSTPSSGKIVYDIEYSPSLKSNSLYSFYPKELVSVFNNDQFKLQVQGALNIYQMDLVNSKSDSCFALIKMFDQKFVCPLNPSDDEQLRNTLSNATIEFFNDSVTNIAGLNSSLMTIKLNDSDNTNIAIHYAANDAVASSKAIFSVIPGIATRIDISHGGWNITVTAREIMQHTNSESDFSLPTGYKSTKQEEITNMLFALIN